MKNKKLYSVKPTDYVLAAIILALFSAPLFSFIKPAAGSDKALVYRNNTLINEISLKADSVTKVGNMEIEVKGGKIRVAKSDCPHKICSHAGWISMPGQSLVCLPNRVLVEIPSKHDSRDYDTVSY